MSDSPDLEVVRSGFELFNSGDLDRIFDEVFHRDVDYSGEPQISVLTGLPVDSTGRDAVREAWTAFFAMFDAVTAEAVELRTGERPGEVLGRGRMAARGGVSEVPIDAEFHFAWVIEDARWRFFAAKRSEEEALGALEAWRRG